MGGLRVDSRELLLRGGKSGPAVTPGDAESSRLYRAVSYHETLKMPPTGKLTEGQIADIAAWINMGAPEVLAGTKAASRDFWAFQPVRQPGLPSVKRRDWVQSPIDAFILAKLDANGLSPTAPADKPTLIRRVTFDLTGLPPTPDEVTAFLNDGSPDAFAKVVDRLLASPQYGERWARHWLDLVRYAETNGHEFDNDKPDPWRYRDYVIRSFNQDLPYDRFVREHIAGDLLPGKRTSPDGAFLDSPVATSYLWFGEVLNSPTDSVKSRADQVDNQIDVTGKAFLGLTVACARCHDHKFDPIPTADYYALAGVFHSTDIREDLIDSPERRAVIEKLSRQIRELDDRIARARSRPSSPALSIAPRPEDDVFADFETGTFGDWIKAGVAFGEKPRDSAANSLAGGSDRFVGSLTSPKFRTSKKRYMHVRLSGTASDAKLKENGPLRLTLVTNGHKTQHVVPQGEKPAWKTLTLTLERERDSYIEIVDRSREGHISVEKIIFSDTKEPPPTELVNDAPAHTYAAADSAHLAELVKQRRDLEEQIPPSAFAMLAHDDQPHNVKVHIRGNHTSLGAEVPRGFLKVVANSDPPPAPRPDESGRLQMAAWLSSADNPLTARVMVNRIWQHHFGRGMVKSVDNFGAMGDRPTHPELLDFLASQFIASGWSIKAMHRLMLLSSTYRMSSNATDRAAKDDPENKLLSHMPVQRLEGEAIRDSILAVSGTLDSKMFGPSIPPYISEFQDGRGKPESGPLDGAGRRSLYIQVRRNFLFLLPRSGRAGSPWSPRKP
jgi:cytochrome c553